MIDRRLKIHLSAESVVAHFGDHLDDDSIAAFVEGCLEENESTHLISHLVQCASCRYATVQLVRLESQVDPEREAIPAESPGRMRSFLEDMAARFAPSFEEDTVFAYQAPKSDQAAESVSEEAPNKPKDD